MENIILTKKVETPMLDAFNALDKNLVVTIFVCILASLIILGVVINVLKLFADMRLSKNLYQAKIAQAEAEKFEAVVSKTASVKAVTEQEKDKALVALLQSFLRQTKLNPEQISQMMNEVKNDSRESSKKATQEFLDEVVKNVNNDVDKVSVEDLEALIFGEDN